MAPLLHEMKISNPMGTKCYLVSVGLLAILLCGTITAQRKQRAPKPPPLSAQQVARRALPAVVLLVCDDGKTASQGSAFFIKPGVLVTNFHVIDGMARGFARLAIGGKRERRNFVVRRVIAFEKESDLALLSVPGARDAGVPALSLALEAKSVEVGETIYALGNPEGLVGTISPGIVASNIRGSQNGARLQITAPISHGSSGGPIVNASGEVVGVAEGFLSEGQNLNFAVPASLLYRLLRETKPEDYNDDLDYISTAETSLLKDSWIWPSVSENRQIDLTPGPAPERKEPEPTIEQSGAWLSEKLEGQSHFDGKFWDQTISLSFSKCNMDLRRSIGPTDPSLPSAVDVYSQTMSAAEKAVARRFPAGNWGVSLYFRRKVEYYQFIQGAEKKELITDFVIFPVRDEGLALRAAKAFNHMIELCGGGPKKEPF